MLPGGYDPANYGGKIWWNENNFKMKAIWGTQKDYDKHISQGGTWEEYAAAARLRIEQMRELKKSEDSRFLNVQEGPFDQTFTREEGSKGIGR